MKDLELGKYKLDDNQMEARDEKILRHNHPVLRRQGWAKKPAERAF